MKKKIIKNKKGMTLVEVVCSCVILAIVALMMVTAFGTTGQIINSSNDLKTQSDTATQSVESKVDGTKKSITIGGRSIEGTYSIASFDEDGNGLQYRKITPDAAPVEP